MKARLIGTRPKMVCGHEGILTQITLKSSWTGKYLTFSLKGLNLAAKGADYAYRNGHSDSYNHSGNTDSDWNDDTASQTRYLKFTVVGEDSKSGPKNSSNPGGRSRERLEQGDTFGLFPRI